VNTRERPPLTLAIPAYNDEEEVFARVLDLALTGWPEGPLVVVDMSTTDAVRRVCDARASRVRYHLFRESSGVSDSRNRCVELAETRYVAFLDSDGFPEPGWLKPLAMRLTEDRVAVAGSRILPFWEARPSWLMRSVPAGDWLSLFDLGDEPRDVPRIMGTCYAIDRERAPDPPFDVTVGKRPGSSIGMEEPLLCEAVRSEGWRVVYEPRSVVRHRVPADRMSWRSMWRRAQRAGQETRVWGRYEPIPRRRFGVRDILFQAVFALPFFLGLLAPGQRTRPS
jgi:glycosyltransferase involved in cell wall biosynthesis